VGVLDGFSQSGYNFQLHIYVLPQVVVCGRNQKLVHKLKHETAYPAGMRVVVTGFVDNMPEWMGASDVIITKAGPGTIAEALISGLPLMLNGFIPCQVRACCAYIINF
jgi:1,2-diacylglycerol 3-beta-galactosyltransferase